MQNIKKKVAAIFPRLFRLSASIYYILIRIIKGKNQVEVVFTKIYKNKNWSSSESVSGPGSNFSNTKILREELPGLIHELNIKSVLDIPCGDFYWMKDLELTVEKYIGADIVKELIEYNNKLFSNYRRSFLTLDISSDSLPHVDAIFCRDCLPHLSTKLILKSLRQIKLSGAKYLFTSTYTECKRNKDMHVGGFRSINLELKPFYLPSPIKIIQDPCITEKTILKDKVIGLWKISDIPYY